MTQARPLPPVSTDGPHAIGIDVGGTKIAGGIVNLATGTVTARRQIATLCDRGGEAVLQDVAAMARGLVADGAQAGLVPQALGVGVAELVSPAGQVFSGYRIRWRGIDVAARLGPILPTTVSADVRAAALAEVRHGAGRGLGQVYFVTIGTGISGVLVQHGIPFAGARGAALVIANGPTRYSCPACGHVDSAIVEDIASGPGLAAAYGAPAEAVLAAAEAGEARALTVIAHATRALGRNLALLAGALDPAALIIGGGLGAAPGVYFRHLTVAIRAGLWVEDPDTLVIAQAALGRDAGLIGAAAATLQAMPVV